MDALQDTLVALTRRLAELEHEVERLRTREAPGNFTTNKLLYSGSSGGVAAVPTISVAGDSIEIGQGGSGNRYAYIDLVGDDTYTDFGARFIRDNSGANGNTNLVHRGTGNFTLTNLDGGRITISAPGGEWITPTLLNSWTNYGVGTTPAAYRIDAENTVHLRGMVKGGTIGTSTPIFQLPAGYRPSYYWHLGTASNNAFGAVRVDATGDVHAFAGNNAWVSLDNLSFRLGS